MAHLQQIRDPSFCFAEIDLLIRPLLLNTSLTSPFTSDPFRNTSCSSFHDALSEWEMEAPLPPPHRFQGEENKFVEAEACINEFKQDRESVAISGSRRTCDHFWDMIEGSTIKNTISLQKAAFKRALLKIP